MFLGHTNKLAFLAIVGVCSLAMADVITFDAASDVQDNFRPARGTWTWSNSDGGIMVGGTAYNSTALYDTTPGDGTATTNAWGDFTASADLKVQATNSTTGFHLRHNGSAGIRVAIQVKHSDSWDRLRVYAGVDPTQWDSSGTKVYDEYTNSTPLPEADWSTMQIDVSNVDLGNGGEQVQIVMSILDGGTLAWSDTATLSVADSADYLNPGEVGLFASGTDDPNQELFDNFQIVPEPASIAMLGLGGILACRRRR